MPRRRWSASTWLGLLLLVVILGSGVAVLVRFVWPAGDPPRAAVPDAASAARAPADAGPAAPPAVSKAPFTLVPSATAAEKRALAAAVDRHAVTRRGLPGAEYGAYLTGVDALLAALVIDGDGRALDAPDLPPLVDEMVQRAAVGEAVAATIAYVRATGELPPLVRNAVRMFLSGRSSTVTQETADTGGVVAPYTASVIAAWLEPHSRTRLAELAYANDALGRWCEPPEPPRRHFVPFACERPALVAALRALAPGDSTAHALERWAGASEELTAGELTLSAVRVQYGDVSNPNELSIVVALTAPAPAEVSLLAGHVARQQVLRATTDPGVYAASIPRRVVAPVLRVAGVPGFLRLPAPPFGLR